VKEALFIFLGAFITWLFGWVNDHCKEKKIRKQKLSLLLVEIEGNKQSAKNYSIVGKTGGVIMDSKIWEESKNEIFSLPTDLQENLRNTYSQITRYNSTVSLNLYRYEGNETVFRTAIEEEAQKAQKMLEKCEAELRKLLKIP
jgi:hypothetical protein